jgi:hypothetical protein
MLAPIIPLRSQKRIVMRYFALGLPVFVGVADCLTLSAVNVISYDFDLLSWIPAP